MIPDYLYPLANHLWQSTLFVLAAAALTLLLRKCRATVRHGIWLLASIKFMTPFSLLIYLGEQFSRRTPNTFVPLQVTVAMDQIGRPFSASLVSASYGVESSQEVLPIVLVALWLAGTVATAAVWLLRWWRIREIRNRARVIDLQLPIPALATSEPLEPGVFGVWAPVLLLPEGILRRLSPSQLDAVLAHELCHFRRRDNLATAVHSITQVLFWFYPLIWWVGSRMIAEQESACDEEVLKLGHSPAVYAEGILEVCRSCVASSFPGGAAIGGSDLKKRVAAIMTQRPTRNLSAILRAVLAASGMTVIAWPVLVGVAQEKGGDLPKFEVATIKPTKPGSDLSWAWCHGSDRGMAGPWLMGSTGASRRVPASPALGRCEIFGTTVKGLIGMAYGYTAPNQIDQQIVGGPAWIQSARFDVEAKAENLQAATESVLAQMIQRLLADRFNLRVHQDTRNVQGYNLIIGKNGSRLKEVAESSGQFPIHGAPGDMSFNGVHLGALSEFLSMTLGNPVRDKTGLAGNYSFSLRWMPNEHEFRPDIPVTFDPNAPSLATALQEQLGLKLESAKVSIPVIMIDSVRRPSEN